MRRFTLRAVFCRETSARRCFVRLELYVRCTYSEGMAEILKEARWNLRVNADANTVVRRAAQERHQNLTDFVLAAALAEAERVLADRTSFPLDEERWNEFVDAIDRPVRDNPGLDKLFDKPNVFE